MLAPGPQHDHAAADAPPMIVMRSVGKRFGATQVLKNIDLEVRRGERIVVCGPSGSGKSTLIRCVNRLEAHDEGSITVNGIVLRDADSAADVRRETGMVFQSFNLFPNMTVLENCMLAPRRALGLNGARAETLALKYLRRVAMAEHAQKFPAQISGGQQQRVAIARALCLEPRIMLFDEPTSALDPELTGEVLQVIEDLAAEGMTMICVTHEMGFARRLADRCIFIDHGEIVEDAPTDLFFSAPRTQRLRAFLDQVIY
jgi:general L-amino acid transport system ATP-binding protein